MLVLCSSNSAFGRTTTLSGSVSMGQEYDSNIFRMDTDHEERWTSSLLPTLTLLSESEKDVFSFIADSDLQWDQTRDERDFEHNLSLSGTRELSKYLRITIGNDYQYNDGSPESDMDDAPTIQDRFARASEYQREQVARLLFPEIEYSDEEYYIYCLSQVAGRYNDASSSVQAQVLNILSDSDQSRRSWENEFSFSVAFEYYRDSIVEVGWRYFVRDDREGYAEDYAENSPYVSLTYRFNSEWRGLMRYELTETDNEDTDDETRNMTELGLEHNLTTADLLRVNYQYESIAYDEDRDDWNEQIIEFGWDHQFGPHMALNTALETNYRDLDELSDERGVELSLGVSRTFQRGSASVEGNMAFDERKDSGDWDKYRREMRIRGVGSYQLLEDLTGNVNFSYEKRYDWLGTGSEKATYDDYEAGAGLSWSFGQWYALSLNYMYERLDADNSAVSDYFEHTVMLRLTASKDLLKWN
jgi:hypothetical protein